MKPRREDGPLKPVEVAAPIYEGKFARALMLLNAGFLVRSPSLLKPVFRPKFYRLKSRRAARASVPPAWGFVYIFPAGPILKIGISDAGVEHRWNSIRSGNPLLEPAIHVSPPVGKLAREIERAAHEALREYHTSGEWFRCSRELAIETVQRLTKEHIDGKS